MGAAAYVVLGVFLLINLGLWVLELAIKLFILALVLLPPTLMFLVGLLCLAWFAVFDRPKLREIWTQKPMSKADASARFHARWS